MGEKSQQAKGDSGSPFTFPPHRSTRLNKDIINHLGTGYQNANHWKKMLIRRFGSLRPRCHCELKSEARFLRSIMEFAKTLRHVNGKKVLTNFERVESCVKEKCKWMRCKLRRIPDAKRCKGWSCSRPGQFCPATPPGSKANGYCCVNNKWKPGKC